MFLRRARYVWAICLSAAFAIGTGEAQQPLPDDYKVHREGLLRQLAHLISAGQPAAAAEFANREIEKTARLGRNDPRRGNAVELSLQLAMRQIGDDRAVAESALTMASELVRIRRSQTPPDAELLATALLTQGTVLFALERNADADRVFEERLQVLRRAYPANDPKLAEHLSATARTIEEGYHRPARAAKLYAEAIAIRENAGASRTRSQAADLQGLGMLQMDALHDPEAGEKSLTAATGILEEILAKEPQSSDVADGLLQLLVLRSGIARQRGAPDEALELLTRASRIPGSDPRATTEHAITVSLGMARLREAEADFDGAISEYRGIVERIGSIPPADRSDDEKGIVLDAMLATAKLFVHKNELVPARYAIETAIHGYTADDPQLPKAYFVLAEIERLDQHPGEQAAAYREALKLSRQSASEQIVYFATNRAPLTGAAPGRFGNAGAKTLTFGKAAILVPGGQYSTEAARNPAGVEAASYGAATSADRLTISGNPETSSAESVSQQAERLIEAARLYPRSVLVFIHGYNVSFDDALKRMGQLKRDLNYDSAAFVFSWPSAGQWWRYGTDRVTAEQAADKLVELLTWIAHSTKAERIHVIAHSMGNRVLLPALANAGDAALKARIGEVVLAAPAVATGDFSGQVQQLMKSGIGRLTLYASRNDIALRAGFVRELGTTLAGYVPDGGPIMVPGLDTIDVSEGGNEAFEFNHDVFAANPAIIDDIRQLLQTGRRPPGARLKELSKRTTGNAGVYWYYVAPAR